MTETINLTTSFNKVKVSLIAILSILLVSCDTISEPAPSISKTPEKKYVFPIGDFDATQIDGNPKWEFNTGGNINVPIGGTERLVLAIVSNGQNRSKLFAIKVEDGTLAWSHDIDGIPTGGPVSHGDNIYIGTKHGTLICISTSDGNLIWENSIGNSMVGPPIVNDMGIFLSAGEVYRLSLEGKVIWKEKFAVRSVRPLSYRNGILVVIASDNMLYLLNANNGSKRNGYKVWFSASGGAVIDSSTVYITGDRSFVQALDINSEDYLFGRAIRWWWTKAWLYGLASTPHYPPGYLWQKRGLGGKGDLSEPIKISENNHLIQSISRTKKGTVLRLDPITGEVMWKFSDPNSVFTDSAVLLDKSLILSTKSGNNIILDHNDGTIIHEFQTEKISQGPIRIQNKLIMGISDGTLVAIDLN